jgi:tetratricopeptide (TPR) repeat protein
VRGDYDQARACLQESLAIDREFGDRYGEGQNLQSLGHLAFDTGDFEGARSLYEQTLIASTELEDLHMAAVAKMNLGNVAGILADYDAAQTLFEEALHGLRATGDEAQAAMVLGNLATVALDRGDLGAAKSLRAESLRALFLVDDRMSVAESLQWLGSIECRAGAYLQAARAWGAAERLREEIGAPMSPRDRAGMEAEVEAARAAANDTHAFEAAWAEGRAATLEQAIELALTAPAH